MFVGTEDEHNEFGLVTGLKDVRWYGRTSVLGLVEVIAGAKVFIGNQSFPYSLAEAMKVPRVLEVFMDALNSLPHGRKGYTRLTPELLDSLMEGEVPPNPGRSYRMTYSENRGRARAAAMMYSTRKRPLTCSMVALGMSEEDEKFVRELGVTKGDGGDYICVVDCSEGMNREAVRKVVRLMMATKKDGLFGEVGVVDKRVFCGTSVYGVSRRVYDDCGLRRDGESREDYTERCGKARYRSFSAGQVGEEA